MHLYSAFLGRLRKVPNTANIFFRGLHYKNPVIYLELFREAFQDRDNTADSEIADICKKGAQQRNTSNRKELRGIRRRVYLRNLRNRQILHTTTPTVKVAKKIIGRSWLLYT